MGENANLVGLTTGGSSRIGVIDQGTTTDFGERIPAHIETGFIDRGTPNRKMCIAVNIRMRRGHVTGTSEPIAHLSWRDDEGQWQSPIPISLGKSASREPVVTLRGLGVYRARAWRFTFSSTTEDLVLASVTEEFEILTQ